MSKHTNYDELERELFHFHNELRENPQSYIQKLKESLKYFRHKIFHPPGEDPIQTYEGQEAIYDAIQFLKTQKPVEELILSTEIQKAYRDHLNDIGSKGITTYEGSDGKTFSDRI